MSLESQKLGTMTFCRTDSYAWDVAVIINCFFLYSSSGKTLAFLIPVMDHISKLENKHGKTSALVLAPTRELALQIEAQCKEFEKTCKIKSLCIYGGVPKSTQRQALLEGVHILVATPGRLVDFVNERTCDLSGVSFLVLDEGTRR
jgi:ATP-dependent RNA helicase DBP3